jgi:hypothetical protein
MSVDASLQDHAAIADPAPIRELMLANLFAVFNERNPKRRLRAAIADPEADFLARLHLGHGSQVHP